jgi:hypothetical protein
MRAASLLAAVVAALLLAPAAHAEDVSPPVISFTPPAPGTSPKAALVIRAKITDESRFFPQVFYRYGSGPYEKALDLKKTAIKDLFVASIPYKSDMVEFYLEAYDVYGNGPARAGDPDSPFKVTLGEPAPPPPPPAAVVTNPPAPTSAPPTTSAPAPSTGGSSISGGQSQRPGSSASSGSSGGGGRVWTWVTGGLGLGLLTGGLLAGLEVKTADDAFQKALAGSKSPSGQTTVTNTAALAAQSDANQSLGTKATFLTVAGAVLVASSVAIYFIEAPSGGSKAGSGGAYYGEAPAASGSGLTVAAAPIEGGAAALIAGRF